MARDAKIEFDEENARIAAAAGENVYRTAVQAGISLSVAEIEAFKTAFPNKKFDSDGAWKKTIEEDIDQALSDYCATGTCKRFIKWMKSVETLNDFEPEVEVIFVKNFKLKFRHPLVVIC